MKALNYFNKKRVELIESGSCYSKEKLEVDEAISELEALQQHIRELVIENGSVHRSLSYMTLCSVQKSKQVEDLESQLSNNPLRLTCDGCEYDTDEGCALYPSGLCCTRFDAIDRYKLKDTK